MTPTELLALRGARLRSAIARSGDLAMLLEATAMEREASKPRRSVLSYLWARVSALSATTPETQELPPGDSRREVQPVGVPGGGDAHADTLATGGPAPVTAAPQPLRTASPAAAPVTPGWSWLGVVD